MDPSSFEYNPFVNEFEKGVKLKRDPFKLTLTDLIKLVPSNLSDNNLPVKIPHIYTLENLRKYYYQNYTIPFDTIITN